MNIKAEYLKASLLFAAKSDVRHYLNGVLFEVTSDARLLMVATDGHHMIVIDAGECDAPAGEYIVKREDIKTVIDRKAKNPAFEVTGERAITLDGLPFATIDGKYPDWRRVAGVPECEEKTSNYNAEYLLDVQKAAKLLAGGELAYNFRQFGDERGVVSFGRPGKPINSMAVVMPVRTGKCADLSHWDASKAPR